MKTLLTKLKTWLIIAVLGATVYAGSTFDAGQVEPLGASSNEWAQIDAEGNVLRIIVADQTFINSGAVGDPAQWVPAGYDTAKPAAIGGKFDTKTGIFISKEEAITGLPEMEYIYEQATSTEI